MYSVSHLANVVTATKCVMLLVIYWLILMIWLLILLVFEEFIMQHTTM